MDLLLAEALAAGMARQAAENAQRPPPDNFFVLPPDAQVSAQNQFKLVIELMIYKYFKASLHVYKISYLRCFVHGVVHHCRPGVSYTKPVKRSTWLYV